MFFPSLSEKIDLHFSDFPSQNPSETSLQQNEKLNQTLFTKKNVSSQIHFIKKANLISKVGFSCREEGIRTYFLATPINIPQNTLIRPFTRIF